NQHRVQEARTQLAFAMLHAQDVQPADLVAAAAALGDRTIALELLRRMRGHMSLISIENDPRFDMLRGDAGFRQLTQAG
ncbi:MAG: hypothetical protein WBA06_02975, partial [Candidatus Aquilonibacter sp.]